MHRMGVPGNQTGMESQLTVVSSVRVRVAGASDACSLQCGAAYGAARCVQALQEAKRRPSLWKKLANPEVWTNRKASGLIPMWMVLGRKCSIGPTKGVLIEMESPMESNPASRLAAAPVLTSVPGRWCRAEGGRRVCVSSAEPSMCQGHCQTLSLCRFTCSAPVHPDINIVSTLVSKHSGPC